MRRKWPDEHLDRYRMLRRLHIAVLIGLAFILVYAFRFWRSGSLASIIGVGIVSAGAFLLAGFLVGFVFGIPRTSTDSGSPSSSGQRGPGGAPQDASAKSAAKSGYGAVQTNSNLVEISDWLTKIIVGVGLVQLTKIPVQVEALTTYIGNGLRDCDSQACKQSSEAFALAIIIFFFCAGFLIGYLWSRLYLQKDLTELSLADQVNTAWSYVAMADQAIDDAEESGGDYDNASRLIDTAISIDPDNSKAHLLKGYILKRKALKALKPEDKTLLLKQALESAREAARLDPKMGPAFYNIASYQALLGEDKTEILKSLSRALEIDAKLKKTASKDEDLASLRDDADFKRLTA